MERFVDDVIFEDLVFNKAKNGGPGSGNHGHGGRPGAVGGSGKGGGSYNPYGKDFNPNSLGIQVLESSDNPYTKEGKRPIYDSKADKYLLVDDLRPSETFAPKDFSSIPVEATKKNIEQLTTEERSALTDYTSEFTYGSYNNINDYLRNGNSEKKHAGETVAAANAVTSALNKSKLGASTYVFRGAEPDMFTDPKIQKAIKTADRMARNGELKQQAKSLAVLSSLKGTIISDRAPLSTSPSGSQFFSNREVKITIKTKPSDKALPITELSRFGGASLVPAFMGMQAKESEVLYAPNTKFEVKDVKITTAGFNLLLETVPTAKNSLEVKIENYAPTQARDSKGRWSDGGGGSEATLSKLSKEIRNKPYEFYYAVDEKGKVISQSSGTGDSVNVNFDDAMMLANTEHTSLHNHPNSQPPSLRDLKVTSAVNAKEARVVSPEYDFVLKRPKAGEWPDAEEIEKTHKMMSDMLMLRNFGKIERGEMTREEAQDTHWFTLNEELAQKFGWEFSYKKVGEKKYNSVNLIKLGCNTHVNYAPTQARDVLGRWTDSGMGTIPTLDELYSKYPKLEETLDKLDAENRAYSKSEHQRLDDIHRNAMKDERIAKEALDFQRELIQLQGGGFDEIMADKDFQRLKLRYDKAQDKSANAFRQWVNYRMDKEAAKTIAKEDFYEAVYGGGWKDKYKEAISALRSWGQNNYRNAEQKMKGENYGVLELEHALTQAHYLRQGKQDVDIYWGLYGTAAEKIRKGQPSIKKDIASVTTNKEIAKSYANMNRITTGTKRYINSKNPWLPTHGVIVQARVPINRIVVSYEVAADTQFFTRDTFKVDRPSPGGFLRNQDELIVDVPSKADVSNFELVPTHENIFDLHQSIVQGKKWSEVI